LCGGLARRNRETDGEGRAAAILTIGGNNGPAHRFDKAAADRKPQTRARQFPVGRLHAIELVEDSLEVALGYAGAFIQHGDSNEASLPLRAQDNGRVAQGIFPRIVEQIEQDLLEQDRIGSSGAISS
jgi:hypothetical protein